MGTYSQVPVKEQSNCGMLTPENSKKYSLDIRIGLKTYLSIQMGTHLQVLVETETSAFGIPTHVHSNIHSPHIVKISMESFLTLNGQYPSVQMERHSRVVVILEQFTSGDTGKSFNESSHKGLPFVLCVPVYCHRKLGAPPKPRLCYNAILLKGEFRWRNEEDLPLSLKQKLCLRHFAVKVPKRNCGVPPP